jgi:ubiquinone/menaquinone biosynthesis C-methylase UbiE
MNKQNNQWNTNASVYSNSQGETGDPLHQYMIDPKIFEMLGNVAGKTILDAGCGNGYWVRRLAKQAEKVIGIDSSSELINDAKSAQNPPNTEYYVFDLLKSIDLPDLYFDIILSSMVFHYLSNIENAAVEFNRILKPNGQVVIAIQHPIYQYHFRAQNKAGGDSSSFSNPVEYFDRKIVKQTIMSGKSIVEIYNRPLSDFIRPFLQQGFMLTDFVEPEYSENLLSKVPRYKDVAGIPRVAIFAFRKS